MRYTLTLYFLLPVIVAHGQAPTNIASTIDAVTVYRTGAEVQRSASIRLSGGRQTLVLDGITAALVEKSLQVVCSNPDVLLLSVRHRHRYGVVMLDAQDQDRAEQDLEDLAARERLLRTRIAIGEEEEAVLGANRDLGGTASKLNAEDLERGVRYHRERLVAIRLERLALQDSLRQIEEARVEVGMRISEMQTDSLPDVVSEVLVELESAGPVTDSLFLTYLVGNAGWDPTYDVRVTELDQPLVLDFSARVRQQTGEDWEDVDLALSTGNPERSARAPELQTWHLAPYRKPPVYDRSDPGLEVAHVGRVYGYITDDGLPLVGASIAVPGTNIGTVADLDGYFSLSIPSGTQTLQVSYTGYATEHVRITGSELNIELSANVALDEVVVVGYGRSGLLNQLAGQASRASRPQGPPPVPTIIDRQPTTLRYLLDTPFTVPSDTSTSVVRIDRYEVPATYYHTAVPKIDERVFLSADIKDWEAYDLMSGELQLFVGGAYLATSWLDVEQTSDSLVISLGADPGVTIQREEIDRYNKQTGLFGGRRSVTRAWNLSARNTKGIPVNLLVYDQVPVSADGGIDVEAQLPEAAEYDPETGLLRWQTTLAPRQGWQSQFAYEVSYATHGPVYLE